MKKKKVKVLESLIIPLCSAFGFKIYFLSKEPLISFVICNTVSQISQTFQDVFIWVYVKRAPLIPILQNTNMVKEAKFFNA